MALHEGKRKDVKKVHSFNLKPSHFVIPIIIKKENNFRSYTNFRVDFMHDKLKNNSFINNPIRFFLLIKIY